MFKIGEKACSLLNTASVIISSPRIKEYYAGAYLIAKATDDILNSFIKVTGLAVNENCNIMQKFKPVQSILQSEADENVIHSLNDILVENKYVKIDHEHVHAMYCNASILAGEIVMFIGSDNMPFDQDRMFTYRQLAMRVRNDEIIRVKTRKGDPLRESIEPLPPILGPCSMKIVFKENDGTYIMYVDVTGNREWITVSIRKDVDA